MNNSPIPHSDANLEGRVTVLETRVETILPTLATKADLKELRGELIAEFHKLEGRLFQAMTEHFKWMIGIFISMFIGMFGITYTMWSVMERTIANNIRAIEFAHSRSPVAAPPARVAPEQPGRQ